jgi:uncharacterized protein (UPF0254 family)
MDSLKFSLVAYAFAIVLALIIACFIPALAFVIKKLNLDRNEEPADLTMPSSNSMQEEQALAVAIAVAHSQRK